MSLLKIIATVGLMFSPEPAPQPVEQPVYPVVGVPFGCGLAFEVSQGHNVGSHLHNDTWAWDFRMPEGVPIVSARSGTIRMARGDSTIGGCDQKFAKHANYVVVDHGDGTEAQYLHFSAVVVEAGQKVNGGELLGFSGKTGWSCGPHLHFKVARRVHNGWNNPSIPAHIDGYASPVARTLVTAPACDPKHDVMQANAPASPSRSQSPESVIEGNVIHATGAGEPVGGSTVTGSAVR